MSEDDRDGRIAQMMSDRHACLAMEIHEHIREGAELLDKGWKALGS